MIITPICFYPTTVIAVDDSQDFLNSLASVFSCELPYKTFSNPKKALDLLNDAHATQPFLADLLVAQESDCETIVYELNLESIADHITNPNRFAEVSTLLVDYSMPQITGLDFCQQVRNDYLRTIMLTGEAGYDLAVTAFNKGLLDRFLLKGAPNLLHEVMTTIQQEQHKYFLNLTKFLLHDATNNESISEIKKVLSDSKIADLFNQQIESLEIVEYYLLNGDCDFLLIDAEGHRHVLAIKTETLMKSYVDLATYSDKSSAEKAAQVIEQLTTRQKVPYFYHNECFQSVVDEWDTLLHPAESLSGDNDTYYWSLLKDCKQLPIEIDDNVTFFADIS